MIKGKNGHSGLKTRTESAYSLPFGLQNESTPATRSDENMLRTPAARVARMDSELPACQVEEHCMA